MAKRTRDRLDEMLRDRSVATPGDDADVAELAGVADAIGRTAVNDPATAAGETCALSALQAAIRARQPRTAPNDVAELAEVADAIGRTSTAGVATAAGETRALAALKTAVRARQPLAASSDVDATTPGGARILSFRDRPMMWRVGAMAAAVVVAAAVWMTAPGVREPVFAMFGSSSSSVKAEARLTSPLNPASGEPNDALASGKAKSEQRSSRTRFSVEVEGVQSEPGEYRVNVTHDGVTAQVATVHVDSFGFGELEMNTQDGLPACPATPTCVPAVVATDTVEVLTPDGGTVVLSGTLASK